MTSSRKPRLAVLFALLVCTVGCDQTSKHIARVELSRLGSVTPPGRFGEFRLAENRGSFLSLGDSLPDSFRLALLTISVGVALLGLFVHLMIRRPSSWMSFIGLGAVWAGGISNLVDRIFRQGRVTDFMFISVGPIHTGIFNVADIMIMIGIAAIAVSLCGRRHGRKLYGTRKA
ncbi:MAG: signal peptidase II [Verrucomicrobiota bacterium]|nr:signal peptidase II [Verrucomicrobiota bacterium]